MNELQIKLAQENDTFFIEELTQQVVSEGYFSPRQNKVDKNYLTFRIRNQKATIYLASINEENIGYIDAEIRNDGICYIARLAIVKTQRGKSLGSQLLSHIEDIAKKQGCHKITLETLVECKSAQCLYIRHDFIPEGVLRNDGYKHDFILMGKTI